MAKKKHLLIGSGAAGLSALKQIRSISAEDEIKVVSMEDCLPYSPTALPYLLSGKIEESKLWIADREYFKGMQCDLLLGKRLVKVLPEEKEAFFEGGERERYDTLLIATGSEPLPPSIPGMEKVAVLGFHTLSDCRNLIRRLRERSQVLVHGGGLVAMGLASGLIQRGSKVSLIVRSRVLRRYFDPDAGALIGAVFLAKGAEIVSGSELVRVGRKGEKVEAFLSDGSQCFGDLLVNCLGTIPRTSFLQGTGIALDGGVIVDRRMRTNKENIYAAGDVVVAKDFFSDVEGVNAILPSAVEQGKIAGSNMAGEVQEYNGWVSMNVFHFFGKNACSIGLSNGGEGLEVLKDGGKEKGWYAKLTLKDGQLVGAQFVNVEVDPGVILYLIKNRLEVEKVKEELMQKPGQVSRWLMARNERV